MNLNNPVNQNASHSFIYALLELHIFNFWLIIHFCFHIMMHDILSVFTNTLRVCSIRNITFFYCAFHVHLYSLAKILIHLIQLFFK